MPGFALLFARWQLLCVTVLLLLGAAPRAHAELPSGVTLSWLAPEGCPDGDFVRIRIGTILGKPAAQATSLDVAGRVEQVRGGFRLLLETREGASHRQQAFEDPSCAQLAETASVVIALVINDASTTHSVVEDNPAPPDLAPTSSAAATEPSAAATEPSAAATEPSAAATEPSAAATEPSAAATEPGAATQAQDERTASAAAPLLRPQQRRASLPDQRPAAPPSPPPARGERPSTTDANRSSFAPWGWTRGLVQAGVLGDLGSLPRPAIGLQLGLRLEWATGVSFVLGGFFFPKTRGSSEEVSGVEGEFQLSAGTLASCQVVRPGSVAFRGCVGLELGQLRAEAVDADWSSLRREFWVAPHADLGGELPIGPIALIASAGVAVPLIRREYVVDNAGIIHQPSWATGRLTVGAGYRF